MRRAPLLSRLLARSALPLSRGLATAVKRTDKGSVAGTMMDYPLTMNHFFHRAEQLFYDKSIITNTANKGIERTTYGDWAVRTRKLGGILDNLGVGVGARVGTFAWNTARHLEAWFGVPCAGRVLHTLNIRLFPSQLTYVVNHAEDEVIIVDRSLLPQLWPHVDTFTSVKHILVWDDGADVPIPNDPRVRDYEEMLAAAPAVDFSNDDEYAAASMCYTSGTTGDPKGVAYTHRSQFLHALGVPTLTLTLP